MSFCGWTFTAIQACEERTMSTNLEQSRTRARLLLASEKLRELLQFLEKDVPVLIDEVEQLRLELAEIKGQQGRYNRPGSGTLQSPAEIPPGRKLLTSKEF